MAGVVSDEEIGPRSSELPRRTDWELMQSKTAAAAGSLRTVPGGVRRERYDELLERLEVIVLEEGFRSLTVDEIASRLRCSKSTLYAIAPSKEQLFTEVVSRFLSGSERRIAAHVRSLDGDRERLIGFFRSVHDQMQRMSRNCYDDMRNFAPTDKLYRATAGTSVDTVRHLVEVGVANGTFREMHADFVGEAINLLIEGIMNGHFMERLDMSDGEAYSRLSQLVLGALSSEEAFSDG